MLRAELQMPPESLAMNLEMSSGKGSAAGCETSYVYTDRVVHIYMYNSSMRMLCHVHGAHRSRSSETECNLLELSDDNYKALLSLLLQASSRLLTFPTASMITVENESHVNRWNHNVEFVVHVFWYLKHMLCCTQQVHNDDDTDSDEG